MQKWRIFIISMNYINILLSFRRGEIPIWITNRNISVKLLTSSFTKWPKNPTPYVFGSGNHAYQFSIRRHAVDEKPVDAEELQNNHRAKKTRFWQVRGSLLHDQHCSGKTEFAYHTERRRTATLSFDTKSYESLASLLHNTLVAIRWSFAG